MLSHNGLKGLNKKDLRRKIGVLPCCANCNIEMIVEKNDVLVVHFLDDSRLKGIDFVVVGTLYRCPGCGCRMVTDFGKMRYGFELPPNYLENEDFIEIKREPEKKS
jgi:hypothetical protein